MDVGNKGSGEFEDVNVAEASILEISTNNPDDTLNYQTADEENSSKYFSMIVDSSLEGTSSADVTLESKSVLNDTAEKSLLNNLSNIPSKSVDKLQIHEKIDAAKILSGGVDIFDDNENSSDEHGLVIDCDSQVTENADASKNDNKKECDKIKENDTKDEVVKKDEIIEDVKRDEIVEDIKRDEIVEDVKKDEIVEDITNNDTLKSDIEDQLMKSEEEEQILKGAEEELAIEGELKDDEKIDNYSALLQSNLPEGSSVVTLLIDDKNVEAIDIGEGVYIYKNDEGDLTAIQITLNEDGTTNFKCLHVGKNEDGNLEVYEEQVSQVPVTTEELESMRSQELIKNPEVSDASSDKTNPKVEAINDIAANKEKEKSEDTRRVENNISVPIVEAAQKDGIVESLKKDQVIENKSEANNHLGEVANTNPNYETIPPSSELMKEDVKTTLESTNEVKDIIIDNKPTLPELPSKETVGEVLSENVDAQISEVDKEVSAIDQSEITKTVAEVEKPSETKDEVKMNTETTIAEASEAIAEESKSSNVELQSDLSLCGDESFTSVSGVSTKVSDPALSADNTDSQDSTSNISVINEESSNTGSIVSSCPSIVPTDSIISEQLSINEALCTKAAEANVSCEISSIESKNEGIHPTVSSEELSQCGSISKSISDNEVSSDSNIQSVGSNEENSSPKHSLNLKKESNSLPASDTKLCLNVVQEAIDTKSLDEYTESQTSVESDDEDYVVGEPVTGDCGTEWNNKVSEVSVDIEASKTDSEVKTSQKVEVQEEAESVKVSNSLETNISDNNNDVSKEIVSEKENSLANKESNDVIIKEIDFDKFVRRTSIQMFEECIQVDYEDVTETIRTKSVPILEMDYKTDAGNNATYNTQTVVSKVVETSIKTQHTSPTNSKTSKSLDISITSVTNPTEKNPSPNKSAQQTYKPTYSPVENNKYMNPSPFAVYGNQNPKAFSPNKSSLSQPPILNVKKQDPVNLKPKTYMPVQKPSPQNLSNAPQVSDKGLSFVLLNDKQSSTLLTSPPSKPALSQSPTLPVTNKPETLSQDVKQAHAQAQNESSTDAIDKTKAEADNSDLQKAKNRQPRKQVFTPVTSSAMEMIFPNLYNNAQEYKKETDAKALKLKKEQDMKFRQLSRKEQSKRAEKASKPPTKPIEKVSPTKPPDKNLPRDSALLSTPVKSFDKSMIKDSVGVMFADKPIARHSPIMQPSPIKSYEFINTDVVQPLNPIKAPSEILNKNLVHLSSPVKSFDQLNSYDPNKVSNPVIKNSDPKKEQNVQKTSPNKPIDRTFNREPPYHKSPVKSSNIDIPSKNVGRTSHPIDLPVTNVDKKTSNHHGIEIVGSKEFGSPRTYSGFLTEPAMQPVYNAMPEPTTKHLESPKSMNVEKKISPVEDVKLSPKDKERKSLTDEPMKNVHLKDLQLGKSDIDERQSSEVAMQQKIVIDKSVVKPVNSQLTEDKPDDPVKNKVVVDDNAELTPKSNTAKLDDSPSLKSSPSPIIIKTTPNASTSSETREFESPVNRNSKDNHSPLNDSAKRKRGRPKKVVTNSPETIQRKATPPRKETPPIKETPPRKETPPIKETPPRKETPPIKETPSRKEVPSKKEAPPVDKTEEPTVVQSKEVDGQIQKTEIVPKKKSTVAESPKFEEKSRASSISPFGKIDENIKCPICFKTFRTHNVLIKHVKHCTGTISAEVLKSPKKRKLTDTIEDKCDSLDLEDESKTLESEVSSKSPEVSSVSVDSAKKPKLDLSTESSETQTKHQIPETKSIVEVQPEKDKTEDLQNDDKSNSKSKDETLETIVLEDSVLEVDVSGVIERSEESAGKTKASNARSNSKTDSAKKKQTAGKLSKDKKVSEVKETTPSKQNAGSSPMSRLSKTLNMNPPVLNPIACTVCGKTFRQLAHMVYHRSSKHNLEDGDAPPVAKNEDTSVKPKPDVVETQLETEAILKCEICNKGFRKLHHLVEHREVHANTESKSRGASVASVKSEPEAGFGCDTCDKSFRKLHHLVEHGELHLTEETEPPEVPTTPSKVNESKPVEDATCPGCGKTFRKRHHMVEHRDVHCSPSKKGKTDDSSATDGNIRLSIASSNSDEGNSCGICGKSYRKLHHMVEHRESHAEVRDEKAKNKSETEHLNTKDIIHECARCYMVFPNENSLNKHSDICKKRALRKSLKSEVTQSSDEVESSSESSEKSMVNNDDQAMKTAEVESNDDVIIVEPENIDKSQPEVDTGNKSVDLKEAVNDDDTLASVQTAEPAIMKKSSDVKENTTIKRSDRKSIVPKQQTSTLFKETISSRSRKSSIIKHSNVPSSNVSVASRSSSVRKSSISSESVSSRINMKRKSSSSVEHIPIKKANTKDSSDTKSVNVQRRSLAPHRRSLPNDNKESNEDDDSIKYKFKENDESDVKYKINPEFNSKSVKRLSQGGLDAKINKPKVKSRKSESALSGLKIPKEKVLQTIMEETNVRYSFPKISKTKSVDSEQPVSKPTTSSQAVAKKAEVPQAKVAGKRVVITKKTNIVVADKRKSLGGRKSIDTKRLPGLKKKLELRCCSQVFNSQSDLAAHRKTHKENTKVHKCDCGKTFDTEGLLKRHMDIEHTPPKSYKCSECGASVRTAAQFAKHKKDHEGSQKSQKLAVSKKLLDAKPTTTNSKSVSSKSTSEVSKTVKAQSTNKNKPQTVEIRKGVKRKTAHGGVPLSDKMMKAMAGAKFQ